MAYTNHAFEYLLLRSLARIKMNERCACGLLNACTNNNRYAWACSSFQRQLLCKINNRVLEYMHASRDSMCIMHARVCVDFTVAGRRRERNAQEKMRKIAK